MTLKILWIIDQCLLNSDGDTEDSVDNCVLIDIMIVVTMKR